MNKAKTLPETIKRGEGGFLFSLGQLILIRCLGDVQLEGGKPMHHRFGKAATALNVAILVVLLLAAIVPSVQANSITVANPTVTPVGPNFQYDFAVALSAGSAALASLPSFVSFFDVWGYIPGSFTGPAGWSLTTPMTGLVAFLQAPSDNPGVINLVATYTGTTIVGPASLGTFSFKSVYNVGPLKLTYNSQDMRTSDESKQGNSGLLNGPTAVPEPSMFFLMGLGLVAFGAVARRKRGVVH